MGFKLGHEPSLGGSMPIDTKSRVRPPFAPMIDLPPPFRLVTLREVDDAFAHATAITADEGPAPWFLSAASTSLSSRSCSRPTRPPEASASPAE